MKQLTPKRGEVYVSTLAQGDIVAAPWKFVDQPGVEQYLLGEVGKVGEAEKTLSISFFSDGKSAKYSWNDQETTNILKVNDVTAGALFKTCGAPTNDAPPPAFEVPAAPTPLTSPFSEDSSCDLDFDPELQADLPGFLSASCAKVASSPPISRQRLRRSSPFY